MKKNKLNKTKRKKASHRAEKRANRSRKTQNSKSNRRAKFEESRNLFNHNKEKAYRKQTGRNMYPSIPKKEETATLIKSNPETK